MTPNWANTRIALLPLLCIFVATGAYAQAEKKVLRNSKIYIEELPLGLGIYLKAEIIKKKVPILVVATPERADYLLRGTAGTTIKLEGSTTSLSERFTGAVEIFDGEGTLIWAAEAGDSSLGRGGLHRVAKRIASKLKKFIARSKPRP